MNLELQTLTWSKADSIVADALIVPVPHKAPKAAGLLSSMLTQLQKTGDFKPTKGRTFLWWKPPGWKASRLVFVGTGEDRAQDIQQALSAAIQSLKKTQIQRVVVLLTEEQSMHLVVAAQAVSDAAYTYVATKPSAQAFSLQSRTFGVPNQNEVKPLLNLAKAQKIGRAHV